MRTKAVAVALAATLAVPGFALAQQGATGNTSGGNMGSSTAPMSMAPATQSSTGAAPGTTTGPAASPTVAGGTVGGTVNNVVPGATNAAGGRPNDPAQGNAGSQTSSTGMTNRNPGDAPNTTTTPAAGANSFTEGQARSRIEAAGYSNVGELRRDDQGVWRGRGTRNGQQQDVGLDFQGNVVIGSAGSTPAGSTAATSAGSSTASTSGAAPGSMMQGGPVGGASGGAANSALGNNAADSSRTTGTNTTGTGAAGAAPQAPARTQTTR